MLIRMHYGACSAQQQTRDEAIGPSGVRKTEHDKPDEAKEEVVWVGEEIAKRAKQWAVGPTSPTRWGTKYTGTRAGTLTRAGRSNITVRARVTNGPVVCVVS